MHEFCTFHIEVRDEVDEQAFNIASPLRITVCAQEAQMTRLTVRTDQSGLIGLLRHLHRQGFVLLSVIRATGDSPDRSTAREVTGA